MDKNDNNTRQDERLTVLNKLTEFQQDLVFALEKSGFTYNYFSTWIRSDSVAIEVNKFYCLSDILDYMHEQGKEYKKREICKALGL